MRSGVNLQSNVRKVRARRLGAAATMMLALLSAATASAQVVVSDAWVRGTVPGQDSTGAYMRLAAATDSALVAVNTPVAKVAEIHEMQLQGGVMRMHGIPQIPLPAGKMVELQPGGYHVMLMKLARPLKDGDTVPLKLTVQDAAGSRTTIEINATVRPLTASGASPKKHGH
jgi:copper(I)-binding protein